MTLSVLSSKTEVTKLRSRSSKRFPSLFRTSKIEPLYVGCCFQPWILVFILSNNHINDLITTPLDFMDEDVVSQYISFLKLLSMNLTPDTVQFFYNYVCFECLSLHNRQNRLIPFPYSLSAASSMIIPSPWFALLFEQSH